MTASRRSDYAVSAPAARRRWFGFTLRQHLGAVAAFAAVTLVFFFPLFTGDTFSDIDRRQHQVYPWASLESNAQGAPVHVDYDDSFYPWQVFVNRELREGRLPFWNPYSFGGAPFLASGQNGVLYPPRLALSLTVSPTRVHDVLLVTHFFLAGVAMFLLLGFVGLSFPAALVGGLAWMTNSFALSWQMLDHYTTIEVWLPIGVLLAHAVVRRRSWAATFALALVLGLLFVGGNVLFAELVAVVVGAYALTLSVAGALRDRASLAGNAARLLTTAVLGAGLCAVSIIPTLALARESARVSLSYDELARFALPWSALANLFRQPPLWAGDPYHVNLFAGTAVGVLALFGVVRRNALGRFATVLAALTILFMLHTPVTLVVDQILPGFGSFKPLGRAAFLLQFALAVLAAFGLESVLRWLGTPAGQRLVRSRFLAGALVGAAVGALLMLGRGRLGGSTALVLALIVACGLALVFESATSGGRLAPRSSRLTSRLSFRPAAGAVLVVLVAVSVVGQARALARHVMPHQAAQASHLYPPTPLIQRLTDQPNARLIRTRRTLQGSTAMIFPLHSAGGYESLLPSRIQNFWRVVGDGLSPAELAGNPLIYAYDPRFELSELRPDLLARAGVQYVIAPPPSAEPDGVPTGLGLRYSGPDGRVFSIADATPRAYLVAGCEGAETPLAALERFVSPSFAATDAVILERESLEAARLSCSAGSGGRIGTASIRADTSNTLVVSVTARQPGWLVVTDSWDPGWRATIDNRRSEVLPANHSFRAVPVTAGTHTVTFTYEPERFRFAAWLSAVSLAVTLGGLLVTLVVGRRRGVRAADLKSA